VGILTRKKELAADEIRQAGELLPIEAIDRSGLMITSNGAFVRTIEVTPLNPLLLSREEAAQVAASYQQMISRLKPGQSIQFLIDSRPVNLAELLAASRHEVAAHSGEMPSAGQAAAADPVDLSRWRLYAAMEESLHENSEEQAAAQLRAFVIVPFMPPVDKRSELLSSLPFGSHLGGGELSRDLAAHRRLMRQSLAHTDAIRSEVEATGLPARILNGEEVVKNLWSYFNPSSADTGLRSRGAGTEVLVDLDTPRAQKDAERAAGRLREAVAQSGLDFESSNKWAFIDRDVEQTIYVSNIVEASEWGWLMAPMMTRASFRMSVFIHAMDRRRERARIKRKYNRTFSINRGAEAKGRPPDVERYAQEDEHLEALGELGGKVRASVFRVSIYQTPRVAGPEPDLDFLSESVDWAANELETASDCRVNRGEFQQETLWRSTLPLGIDVAHHAKRYVTRNAADMVPLVGTACGSPSGVPFAFSEPLRTLERINVYDRSHENHSMVLTGKSGKGKTHTANVLLSRHIAHGTRAFVVDRAGHFEILTRLLDGAQHITIGAEDTNFAINPWDVEDPSNVSQEKIGFLLSLHATIMGEEGLTMSERSHLGAAIRQVYLRSCLPSEGEPCESALRNELERRADEHANTAPEMALELRNMVTRLGEFCGDGSYAYLMDRRTSVSTDAPLVVFDTRRVPKDVLPAVTFAIAEFVKRRVEIHAAECEEEAARPDAPLFTGRSILMIDECWALLETADTGTFLNELARRARHLGMCLLVSSQALSDFDTEHGRALLRNCTQQIHLAQEAAEIPFIQETARLSDEEAALLARLRTVKGQFSEMFWINGTRGRGKVSLRLGPSEYWAFTSDPHRDVPRRNQAIAENDGDVWAAIHQLSRESRAGRGPTQEQAAA
jgi:hypothetical protein